MAVVQRLFIHEFCALKTASVGFNLTKEVYKYLYIIKRQAVHVNFTELTAPMFNMLLFLCRNDSNTQLGVCSARRFTFTILRYFFTRNYSSAQTMYIIQYIRRTLYTLD